MRGARQTLGGIFGAVMLAALLVALLAGYMKFFAPRHVPLVPPADESYDPAAMRAALAPAAVEAHQARILACGSRFMSQPGAAHAAALVEQRYRAAGLEVFTYPMRSVAPQTLDRRMLVAGPEKPLEVYPLLPAVLQPMNTPLEGLAGRLTLVTDELLLSAAKFDDAIAVIDTARPPRSTQLVWTNYARLGFRAVIFADRTGLQAVPFRPMPDLAGPVPANFIRVAAGPEVFDHLGKDATLHVRTQFTVVVNPVIVGVLKAGATAPARSALVMPVSYDAPSFLPDLAQGALSAVPLATQMALVDGLASYRAQLRRDVVFVAFGSSFMAHEAQLRTLAAIASPGDARVEARKSLLREQAHHAERLNVLAVVQKLFADERFLVDVESSEQALGRADLQTQARDEVIAQLRWVINQAALERFADRTTALVAFRRAGEKTDTTAFADYRDKKAAYDEVAAVANLPVRKLLTTYRPAMMSIGLRDRVQKRFADLTAWHQQQGETTTGLLRMHDLVAGYDETVALACDALPSGSVRGELCTVFMGDNIEQGGYVQYPTFANIYSGRALAIKDRPGLRFQGLRSSRHGSATSAKTPDLHATPRFWNTFAIPAVTLVHVDRTESYEARSLPISPPWATQLSSMAGALRLNADTSLWLARGNGIFRTQTPGIARFVQGRVYAASIGQSVMPTHTVANAVWIARGPGSWDVTARAYYRVPVQVTDPYGAYAFRNWVGDWPSTISPDAALYDAVGRINWIKDQSAQAQMFSRSMDVTTGSKLQEINLALFHAAPIAIFDLANPQTFASYPQVQLLTRETLAAPEHFHMTRHDQGATVFVEPDRTYYVTFKAGLPENPAALKTHAFMLGPVPAPEKGMPSAGDIQGLGFLAADSDVIHDVPAGVAQSMLLLNERRLALQNSRSMADERTNEFHRKAAELLQQSQAPELTQHQRTSLARDSATYSILNHPVLRSNIGEAVAGLLWYLALLVPFAFFFERLAFGFSDIRRQLLVQGLVILVVFGSLKVLHPAFGMIRSSLMILLGFVILLICMGVTLILSAKFKENLAELRKHRGQVAGQEINALSVVGTAFMIGLNNMHRRKVRTILTCATLVLLTFAMICFTSTASDLTDTAHATGKASFQGFVVKNREFRPVTATELYGLRARYGAEFNVVPRYAYVGTRTWEHQTFAPQIEATYESGGREARESVASVLVLSPKEPLQRRITLLTQRGWLPDTVGEAPGTPPPVLVPDTLAQALGLSVATVDAAPPIVRLNGRQCRVWGIFAAASLGDLRDLDGYSLLPFDTEAIRNPRVADGQLIADESDARVAAERVIITSVTDVLPNATASNAFQRLLSVAVDLGNVPYKTGRAVIDQYLEQGGRETPYGLDGVSFRGQRARQAGLVGLGSLLIPLAIAALTVLNTMRASVYERKDEIFVFNSVGIAPRYIFFMFFAEAFVYAVVGAVIGYLLSQGVGRVLTDLGLTGGLVMTFTSINTVLASLAVMAAVFLSTLFPAISAMRMATPSDAPGWGVPDPENDRIAFALPFTFDFRDRIAVLEFFRRILADHGEGGTGTFFARQPTLQAVVSGDGRTVPQITAMIWLKPFDLGVSQELQVTLTPDPETGEYVAQVAIIRSSGTREAWLRLNRAFIAALRQRFLYWRAVDADERALLFDSAKARLTQTTPAEVA